MTTLNPNIQVKSKWKGDPPFITMKYKNHYILCVINGVLYSTFDRELFIDKNIDAIKSVMICDGTTASAGIDDDSAYHLSDESLKNHMETSRLSPFEEKALKSYLNNTTPYNQPGNQFAICYITTIDNWDPEKKYQSRGIRNTQIQGYSQPIEFYSPYYPDISKGQGNDHRRTIYWNPKVTTDENGVAIIRCNNANSSTFLTISCEALYNGQPAAINVHSIKY